jgi:hypothetical protein
LDLARFEKISIFLLGYLEVTVLDGIKNGEDLPNYTERIFENYPLKIFQNLDS